MSVLALPLSLLVLLNCPTAEFASATTSHGLALKTVFRIRLVYCSATDIFPLISEALKRRSCPPSVSHRIMPTNCAHVKMLLRLVLIRTVGEK